MIEKQRTYNLKAELPLSFRAKDKQKHISIGTTLNISAISFSLTTREDLHVGQELPINILLPNQEKITVHSEVIWIKEIYNFKPKEYKVGVRIVYTGREDERKFIKFYAKLFLSQDKEIIEE